LCSLERYFNIPKIKYQKNNNKNIFFLLVSLKMELPKNCIFNIFQTC
jgi:hypothetical protein